MATNLVANVYASLPEEPMPSMVEWLDCMVALHWIARNGVYKQFVANCVAKIRAHPYIHVPTKDNPTDIASRGGPILSSALWWHGPVRLQDPSKWPENPVTQTSPLAEADVKVIQEVVHVAKLTEPASDEIDDLERNKLHRML